MDEAIRLATELERAWLDPESASLTELADLVKERERLIGALERALAHSPSTEVRRAVAQRVRAVYERDAQLHAALGERLRRLQERLHVLGEHRQAVRGYLASNSTPRETLVVRKA